MSVNPAAGYSFGRIITPRVVAALRNYFNCSTIAGVRLFMTHFQSSVHVQGDLEDSGGAGTAGSHWEKRLFMNEFVRDCRDYDGYKACKSCSVSQSHVKMTGTENNFPVRSEITLALFHDSGWYTVNYTNADQFLWGRGQGCDFYEGDCGQWTRTTTMKGLCSKANDPTYASLKCGLLTFQCDLHFRSPRVWDLQYHQQHQPGTSGSFQVHTHFVFFSCLQ